MSRRITRADIEVQALIVHAYSRAAGILKDGDRLTVTKSPGGWSLMVIPAGESYQSAYPVTGPYGGIGETAREALHTLRTIAETLTATLTALEIAHPYPVAAVAAIRGEV